MNEFPGRAENVASPLDVRFVPMRGEIEDAGGGPSPIHLRVEAVVLA